MGWIPIAIAAAGTIISTLASSNAATARKAAAEAQARQQEFNAQLLLQEADIARTEAKKSADRFIEQARGFQGSQIAAQGASGVQVGRGTFANILTDTANLAERDRGEILRQGALAAWRFEQQAESTRLQASATRQGSTSSGLGTAGTFLTGVSNTYAAYANSPYA